MRRCQALALVLLSHLHCSLFSLYLWTSHIQSTGRQEMVVSQCSQVCMSLRHQHGELVLVLASIFLKRNPNFITSFKCAPLVLLVWTDVHKTQSIWGSEVSWESSWAEQTLSEWSITPPFVGLWKLQLLCPKYLLVFKVRSKYMCNKPYLFIFRHPQEES